MEKLDPSRLKFMMDIDEALHEVEKQMPDDSLVAEIKSKFYDLAGNHFVRSVLGDVHEHAIEDIIKRQAEGFYKDFPSSIKRELINEYTEMEHQMRRDKFYNFCLYLYKQIECCMNYALQQNSFLIKLVEVREKKAFQNKRSKWDYKNSKMISEIDHYGYQTQNTLLNLYDINKRQFYKGDDYNAFFLKSPTQVLNDFVGFDFPRRFKMVLYVVKHDALVSEKDYNRDLIIFETIRQSRHLAHGGKLSTAESKITEGIELDDKEKLFIDAHKNRYSNYLLYHGFLADFVQNIPSF